MSQESPLPTSEPLAASAMTAFLPEERTKDEREDSIERPAEDEPEEDKQRVVFASPGVTRGRKIGTGLFLAILAGFTLLIAADQGASVVISTIIAALFIAGFIAYLKIVAPTPFRLIFDADALRREEQGMERIEIPWPNIVKIKEERFPNGLPISLAVYKRVGTKGLHRAFIIYRDDLPGFETFLAALKRRVPPQTRWNIEISHE